ncbi:DUF2993 domain-containing protein [Streptomyces sp. NPDC096142]|uniref:LmeA family phospholipid-binding protein n=1 Tax=Streptomyces sp. NPDC096142 TaxID=3366077 RepID=UPI00381223FD
MHEHHEMDEPHDLRAHHETDAPAEPLDAHGPPRRNRHRAAVAVGSLLALLLVPAAADRVATARVEARTATAFQAGMHTPSAPDVHVRGFPVLTQLASGTLRHVDITAHDLPAGATTGPLPLSELSLRLTDLRRSDDDSEARAHSAEATALLSYPDLSATMGPAISRGSRPGQVRATVPLPTGGHLTVTTTVSVLPGNRIAFQDFQVTGGPPADLGRAALTGAFARPIRLRNIPQGLGLRSVTATDSGLSARLSGESVTFRADATAGTDASSSGA